MITNLHRIFNFDTWTDVTRELYPNDNRFGYNTEKNRFEFYIKNLKKWLYLNSEFIAITQTPQPPYFTENFETMWFMDNIFIQLFVEQFDNNWFVDNSFINKFIEDFQGIDW